MAMHATPFSNSVAVGTEGVKPLWGALDELTGAVVLARLVVAGAEPQPRSMRRRATEGFTPATELANRLVLQTGMSFRQAHHRVGRVVRAAGERGEPLDAASAPLLREHGLAAEPAWLDPAAVAAEAAYGGGPAEGSVRRVLAEVREEWAEAARRLRERSCRWREGAGALGAAVAGVPGDRPPPPPAAAGAARVGRRGSPRTQSSSTLKRCS
jgi:argininosuccinate lyase